MVQFPLHGLENARELFAIYTMANNPPDWMKEAVKELTGWPSKNTKQAEASA